MLMARTKFRNAAKSLNFGEKTSGVSENSVEQCRPVSDDELGRCQFLSPVIFLRIACVSFGDKHDACANGGVSSMIHFAASSST